MSRLSRRQLITAAAATTAGLSGLALAARIADQYGLVPPDHGGPFGLGHTLTYASQRLLTCHTMAREFSRGEISKAPFANTKPLEDETYQRLQRAGFQDWRLTIDGLVARPGSVSLAELKRYPVRSQITQLVCEEGWSFIAEWIGVPLFEVLNRAGIRPNARYVLYRSMERDWSDGMDMADALHPQTLLTLGMNGGDLPGAHGGPLRIRVPRQLGYKSVKYLTGLTVTDSTKGFQAGAYSWYAGI